MAALAQKDAELAQNDDVTRIVSLASNLAAGEVGDVVSTQQSMFSLPEPATSPPLDAAQLDDVVEAIARHTPPPDASHPIAFWLICQTLLELQSRGLATEMKLQIDERLDRAAWQRMSDAVVAKAVDQICQGGDQRVWRAVAARAAAGKDDAHSQVMVTSLPCAMLYGCALVQNELVAMFCAVMDEPQSYADWHGQLDTMSGLFAMTTPHIDVRTRTAYCVVTSGNTATLVERKLQLKKSSLKSKMQRTRAFDLSGDICRFLRPLVQMLMAATTRPMHDVCADSRFLSTFTWGRFQINVARIFKPGLRSVATVCTVQTSLSDERAVASSPLMAISQEDAQRLVDGAADPPAASRPRLQLTDGEFVIKFAKLNHEAALAREKANLEIVKDVEHVVRAVNVTGTPLDHKRVLVLEHVGTALSKMRLTDVLASKLLELLELHIKPALQAIHKLGFIFFDLHPGNVVCDNAHEPTSLCLIDLESLTKVGEKLSSSPLLRCADERRPELADPTFDLARFDKLRAWVESLGANPFHK